LKVSGSSNDPQLSSGQDIAQQKVQARLDRHQFGFFVGDEWSTDRMQAKPDQFVDGRTEIMKKVTDPGLRDGSFSAGLVQFAIRIRNISVTDVADDALAILAAKARDALAGAGFAIADHDQDSHTGRREFDLDRSTSCRQAASLGYIFLVTRDFSISKENSSAYQPPSSGEYTNVVWLG
jgi:hypothetical protein